MEETLPSGLCCARKDTCGTITKAIPSGGMGITDLERYWLHLRLACPPTSRMFPLFLLQVCAVAILLCHLTLLSVFSGSIKDGIDKTVMGILVSYKIKVKLTVPG